MVENEMKKYPKQYLFVVNKSMLFVLLLLIVGCNASLVLMNTQDTLFNGDFPFTKNLPIYNYTCVGSLLVAGFSPSCQIDTSLITASTILVVSWQNASSNGCTFYPDILPQIAGLAQLPCAILYVSTVNGDVGDYDDEPFGLSTPPFLSFPAPLTLIANKIGNSLVQSILTNSSFYTNATLTSQPSAYTILFESSNFQGYRWFFFTLFLIFLVYAFVCLILSLPIALIQHLPSSGFRLLSYTCLCIFCIFQLVQLAVDEAGSTGVMNKVGRVSMAWIALWFGHTALMALLLQWVELSQRLKRVPKLMIDFCIWGTRFILLIIWPLVIIFAALKPVQPSIQNVTLGFQVLLGFSTIFMVVCYFVFGGVIFHILAESKKVLQSAASTSSSHLQMKILQMMMLSNAAFVGVIVGLILSVVSEIFATCAFFFASNIVLQTSYCVLFVTLLVSLSTKPLPKDSSTMSSDTEKSFPRGPSKFFLAESNQGATSRVSAELDLVPPAMAGMLKRIDSAHSEDI